ncbi:hypothetical protein THMIRHAS_15320 [Thiosulfatimonas sediminis]|uniref:Uncharacterized protein n=1 Tax=Thiosulfatimonas sediminis TaxID=2675054 RepID=A0A6F8PVL9_9GAMM|nr:hypothetical protein [Thiosulfatimonas sediminis]BBP46159.1 hypothetical protein THMIRHAS_15320 [Thiosulfatimonas sediminis]
MAIFILNSGSVRSNSLEWMPEIHSLTVDMNVQAKLQRHSKDDQQNWIVYQSPISLLAACLEVEADIQAARAYVQVALQQVIEFYKHNRKQCELLAVEAVSQSESLDKAAALQLSEHFIQQSDSGSVHHLLATYLLQTDKTLAKVVTELIACTAVAAPLEAAIDLNQVLKNHHTLLQNNGHLAERLQTLESAYSVEHAKAQSTIEKLASSQQQLEQSSAAEQQARAKEKASAEQMKAKLETELTTIQSENELIIEQLHHVQELFESEINQKERAKLRIAELQRAIDGLEKRLDKSEIHQLWLRSALQKARKRLWAKNRSFRNELKNQAAQLLQSSEFDANQYLEQYPDVKESSFAPAVHYLLFGAFEARNPSSLFNTLNYVHAYPDVAKAGMQPLIHFIKFGQFEGRKADPLQKRLPAPKTPETKY